MGNIVPRAGIDPVSLEYQASVLTLYHIGSLLSPLYPRPPVYAADCLRGQCRLLHSHLVLFFVGFSLFKPLIASVKCLRADKAGPLGREVKHKRIELRRPLFRMEGIAIWTSITCACANNARDKAPRDWSSQHLCTGYAM